MQWRIVVSIVFALVVALFAVLNVRAVPVAYVFGTRYIPLVLIILGSALFGGLAVGVFGVYGHVRLKAENRRLRKELLQRNRPDVSLPGDGTSSESAFRDLS